MVFVASIAVVSEVTLDVGFDDDAEVTRTNVAVDKVDTEIETV